MIAEIKQLLPDRRMVFGFCPGEVDETAWTAAIGKSCSGPTCEVPSGRLIEFACLDREKQRAVGFDLGQEGYWLGVEIHDDKVWKRIASGRISSFEMALTPDGLTLDFEEKKEVKKMIDENGVFRIEKNCPCHALVSKCVTAVQDGDLGSLTRDHFERALDAVAKKCAAESGLEYHAAYSEILESAIGRVLYKGHASAQS